MVFFSEKFYAAGYWEALKEMETLAREDLTH